MEQGEREETNPASSLYHPTKTNKWRKMEEREDGMNDHPILLAEDNPDDVMLTRRVFEKAGIQNRIVVARDGVEALDYLFGVGDYAGRDTDFMPKLVLLDLTMPRLNGVDVLRRIRASMRTKALPVLLLAGSEELNVLNDHGLSADGYVRKPLDFIQLSDMERQLGFRWQVKANA